MSKPALLLIGGLYETHQDWENLASLATLKVFKDGTRADFLQNCENGEYEDVVVLYRSNEFLRLTGPIDAALVAKLPKSLKFVCSNGAGYDSIDVAACTARGIQVSNTPVVVNDSTADTTIFLLIGALRRIHISISAIRAGEWRGATQLGHDPKDKVLGVLGLGKIGREVAARARPLGLKIQYHNRTRLTPELEQGAEYVSFERLLQTSDILSLNCDLYEGTRGIIGRKEFAQMKDGIVFINTARGGLVDEAALVDALESGKVYSAGLDVYEHEPQVHESLLKNPNVVLLPHVGTATHETQRAMELLTLNNMKSAIEDDVLLTQVPEQRQK
ncbi:putative 2-hydroxyacid dehydrogenase [Podosphaera aphanis]|nr:putative 2-hydroxyacid dehydrogenase [Podosphaera aphanis]